MIHSRAVLVSCVLVAVLLGLAAAQPKPKPPPAWPSGFTMQQVGYWPSQGNAKTNSTWWYDYTNSRHRFDHHTLRNTPLNILANYSAEYWIGNTLYMYNYDKQTCIVNNLGISIPTPNWFLTNTSTLGPLFQYLQHEDYYYEVVQTSTPGPYYRQYGPYNYYALSGSGVPFRMEGPGTALGVVVNDWYNMVTGTPDPSVFTLPATPVCNTGTFEESMEAISMSLLFARLARHPRHPIHSM